MYRYLALSWNTEDLGQMAEVQRLTRLLHSRSPDLKEVLDVPGLRVFHAVQPYGAFRAYLLKGDQGVVLGKLFRNSAAETQSAPAVDDFHDVESERLIESGGRRLIDCYWGCYVAFLRTADGRVRYVLRDPTGGLQCHLIRSAGVDVVLSDIRDCVGLNLPPFSINWEHVVAFLERVRLVTRTTGFKEVTQLYAGECLAIEYQDAAISVSRSFYWHPVSIFEARRFEDLEEARRTLRTAIRECVGAWTSSYDSIVHELSGGLDSSIVAACMVDANTDTDVLCFNYYTEINEGDERSYARAIAQSTGFEFLENEARVSDTKLEALLDRTRVSTPAMLGAASSTELLMQSILRERHAGAVFSGRGGDHLFQESRTRLIAADYARSHGIRTHLFRVVKDVSRLTGKSIWSVWASVVRHGLLGQVSDVYSRLGLRSLLSDDAREIALPGAYVHPWVTDAQKLPSGKTLQIFNVVDCQAFFGRPCQNAERVHPLISQPIIERCLQIPTYILSHGGKSRRLVREAFEKDVPAKIIQRQLKGGTTSHFTRMVTEHSGYLREVLLDGVLVGEGVLDRHKLETALSERELIRTGRLLPIMCALGVETWLSTWADVRQRTAA